MVEIGFNIRSMFDQAGFQKANAALEQLEGTSHEMDMSTKELRDRMKALNATFNDSTGQFQNAQGQFMAFEDIKGPEAAIAAMADQTDRSVDVVENRLKASRMELVRTEEGVAMFRDSITGDMEETRGAITKISNQVQTFNEEALSALFASMAVGRQMGDLTRPGMDAAGVFDLISNTLEIFFLPIALKVRDIILKIRDRLLGTSENFKLLAGAVAIGIGILAKLGTVIAGVILNFGGIATLQSIVVSTFGTISTYLGAAASAIAGAISLPIVAIAAVIGALVGLALAWKNNWFDIREKTGEAVKWIGERYQDLIDLADPVLDSFDWILEKLNKIPGVDIGNSPLTRTHEALQDTIMDVGQAAVDSGEKIDKMKNNMPEDQKQGFLERHVPGVGGSKTQALGADSQGTTVQRNNFKNNYKIETRKGQDERQIAKEVDRMHKKSQDQLTREP